VRLLKSLAASGTTVVASIHQPRGSIYNLFDDLILVAQVHLT
jgi:ABC-type multidrug transport system ATPase subunit